MTIVSSAHEKLVSEWIIWKSLKEIVLRNRSLFDYFYTCLMFSEEMCVCNWCYEMRYWKWKKTLHSNDVCYTLVWNLVVTKKPDCCPRKYFSLMFNRFSHSVIGRILECSWWLCSTVGGVCCWIWGKGICITKPVPRLSIASQFCALSLWITPLCSLFWTEKRREKQDEFSWIYTQNFSLAKI